MTSPRSAPVDRPPEGFLPLPRVPGPPPPLVVAYGVGVDSTAMLIGMHARGIRPDLILFADTGSEKRETYAYLPVMARWLAQVGFPPIVVVRKVVTRFKNAPYDTLEGNCLSNSTLPGLAFHKKSCSVKWKKEPQDKYVNNWAPARLAWLRGQKVTKAIGYDAGKKDARRAWRLTDDAKYHYIYPLRDWGWDRERCQAEIRAAGLPVPMKSACFFCPASQPEEIRWLAEEHPDLAQRIVAIEARAASKLRKAAGLWWGESMTTFLRDEGLLRRLPVLPSNELGTHPLGRHYPPGQAFRDCDACPGT
jgi:hypothetical protein